MNFTLKELSAITGGELTLPDGSDATVTNGVIIADRFDAWQHNWKVEPWKAVGKSFDKREYVYVVKADGSFSTSDEDVASPFGTEVLGKVTLKFSANGTAKVAGEFATYDADGNIAMKNGKPVTVKASGSATLLPTVGEDGETRYLVFVYLAPKGLPPHARCMEIVEAAMK